MDKYVLKHMPVSREACLEMMGTSVSLEYKVVRRNSCGHMHHPLGRTMPLCLVHVGRENSPASADSSNNSEANGLALANPKRPAPFPCVGF